MRTKKIATLAALGTAFAMMGIGAAPTAHAATCPIRVDIEDVYTSPWVNVPCMGNGDMPVSVDHAIVTSLAGPGYGPAHVVVPFVKVNRGGAVTFVHNGSVDRDATYDACYRGPGFDSGRLSLGETANVAGVSSLPVGTYNVTDCWGYYMGDLVIVDPPSGPVGPVTISTVP